MQAKENCLEKSKALFVFSLGLLIASLLLIIGIFQVDVAQLLLTSTMFGFTA